jgi:hypothetical protein
MKNKTRSPAAFTASLRVLLQGVRHNFSRIDTDFGGLSGLLEASPAIGASQCIGSNPIGAFPPSRELHRARKSRYDFLTAYALYLF